MRRIGALVFIVAAGCGGSPGGDAAEPMPANAAPAPTDTPVEPAPTAAETAPLELGPFKMAVPVAWTSVEPTSKMRAAQFTIGDAELIIYHFGAGGSGSVQANLDRWYGQFQQADGSATKDVAKTRTTVIGGLTVTVTDVSGNYVAAVRPGAPEKHDKPDQRMLAAIVETAEGAYYFKLLGPSASVAAIAEDWDAAIASVVKTR